MNVIWDEAKRESNLRKHGIDFADVQELFEGHTVTFEDERNYGEERFITIGLLHFQVVVIIYVYRDENGIRLISARRATNYEQKLFFTA